MYALLTEIRFYVFQLRLNFRNMSALRGSFLLIVFGSIISNLSFFIIWIFFSRAIGPVNGWGPLQTFGMICVNTIAFGLCHAGFGSTRTLQPKIQTGALDGLLIKPKNLYVRIINSEAMPMALGWLVQGALGLGLYFWLAHVALIDAVCVVIMLVPAVIAQVSFLMVTDCVGFWFPQAPDLSRSLNEVMFAAANQPISLLSGGLRLFYLLIIPALLVAGLPVELVTYHKYELIVLAYGISIGWLVFSAWFLRLSIRRYESGNGIGG